MAFRLVSGFRPRRLVPNPAFDLADEREVARVSSHEDESVIQIVPDVRTGAQAPVDVVPEVNRSLGVRRGELDARSPLHCSRRRTARLISTTSRPLALATAS